ncbi:MAG TPA: hypothetical protein VM901_01185 [Bdellovibrionota bacterium]|jgi:mevalonate kinase|nr:hypothetical protein [Bdellovibrionota bacterium]
MISIRIPAKILLFGEWAVLRGKACVGLPLNANFTLHATSAAQSELRTENADLHASENLLETDPWVREAWRAIASVLPIGQNFLMRTQREWQLREGLGSSSALFLALLELHESIRGTRLEWSQTLELFRKIPENLGSGMDLAIQRARTPIVYRNFRPERLSLRWPRELILMHGHRKANSALAIRRTEFTDAHCAILGASVEAFLNSDFSAEAWIRAMREHAEVQTEMKIIPPEAFELFGDRSLELEAMKSVGAGGMDGFLVWARDPDAFRARGEDLAKFGWYLSPYGALET